MPSHHAPDGAFRNPWPDSEPRTFRDVLRWQRQRGARGRVPSPPRGSFPVAKPELIYPRAPAGHATATWIGHSTVLLQIGGKNILTDPMFSDRASPISWAGPRRIMAPSLSIDALPPIDVVLQSHNHYDHLDRSSVNRLAARHPGAVWVVPLRLGKTIRKWGVREIREVDWWESVDARGVRVTGTPARHFSARGVGDRNHTLWCGFAVTVGERRVYFAGDSAYHPEFVDIGARCGPFDFIMMPIGAYDPRWFMHVVHVDAEEAVQAYQDVSAARGGSALPLMLAIHWGTFRLTDEPMDEPPTRARARWAAVGLPDSSLWIARFGETRGIA